MITDERLKEIKARAEAATPGPWNSWAVVDGIPHNHVASPTEEIAELDNGEYIENPNMDADAKFIAHARQDVPDLIAEVERLEAKLKNVTEGVVGRMPSEYAAQHKLAAIRKKAEPIDDVLENIRRFRGGRADVKVYADDEPGSVKFIVPLDGLRALVAAIKETE